MKTEMNNPIDELSRRTFIKLSAIAGAGLMLGPSLTFGEDASEDRTYFVNGMIPACLLLQTAELARKATFVSQEMKKALDFSIYLTNEANFAFAGLLPHEWKALTKSSFADMPKEKQAFKAGMIVSNTANEHFSEIYSNCERSKIPELRLYHDACLLKHVSDIDIKQVTKEELVTFLRTLVSPMITRTHTLRPDRDDGMNWIVRMTKWNRDYYAYAENLADIMTKPDPIKVDNYIKKLNFIDLSDKSIRYAIEGVDFGEMHQVDGNRSLYGKALYESLKRIYDGFK